MKKELTKFKNGSILTSKYNYSINSCVLIVYDALECYNGAYAL